MKPRRTHQNSQGMTMVEVLVVIVVLTVLAAILLPALTKPKNHSRSRFNCYSRLKQLGLSYQIWAGDNYDKYPMETSVTNGGTMEIFSRGSQFQNLVFLNYLTMPNELSTPKVLHCPSDINHVEALNFTNGFNNSNISYFVGLDANVSSPHAFLSGDDNFAISGVPVKSGLLELSANTPVTWSAARHKFSGNIGLADGSVQSVDNSGLANLLHQTGLATNRLALP